MASKTNELSCLPFLEEIQQQLFSGVMAFSLEASPETAFPLAYKRECRALHSSEGTDPLTAQVRNP
jgi:hypothetical protein